MLFLSKRPLVIYKDMNVSSALELSSLSLINYGVFALQVRYNKAFSIEKHVLLQ